MRLEQPVLPRQVVDHLTATSHQLILAGLAAQPPPLPVLKHRGRVKQTKAKNLLDRLKRDAPSVLLFMTDFRVPFTNNLAERSVRPLVVARKISGGSRSPQGSETRMGLASLFGTWIAQKLNPFHQCLAALTTKSSLGQV